jgi:hypothetical protein
VSEERTDSYPAHVLDADLCVVGGGMAGLIAAIAAARGDAKVILVQDRPVLGGNASSEVRMQVCGAHGADAKEGGILEEIMLENLHRNPTMNYTVWDHVLYGKCMEERNLTVLLNTAVHDVTAEGAAIKSVTAWHLLQQCGYKIRATLFADCSGDSVLRKCGARFRWGRESRQEFGEPQGQEAPDQKTMGNTILFQLREVDRHVPFIPPSWAYSLNEDDFPQRPFVPSGHNFWWIELGGTMDTIGDSDRIRDELLKIAYGVWAFIKNHPDGRGRNWELDWIGSLPGKRENIRYVGDRILTQNDIESQGRFDDIVAYGGWTMDDHNPEGIYWKGPPTNHYKAPIPYGIPYRSLYSANIGNLFFAGRNISATHMAMSSTRVMATTSLMGQAVGTAAAIATKHNTGPRGVYEHHLKELQQTLIYHDCWLPGLTIEPSQVLQSSKLTASTGDANVLRDLHERDQGGADHGWWAGHGDWVCYELGCSRRLNRARVILDSDFRNRKVMPWSYPRAQRLASLPSMLVRDFDIESTDGSGRWVVTAEVRDNRRRFVDIDLGGREATAVRLVIRGTWGSPKAHVFAFDIW